MEKSNVNNHVKEAVSLLLENRPENPILFLADHFKNLQSGSSSNVMRAYRLLTLNKYDSKSFQDNVFAAYTLIEKDNGNSGIKGFDLIKIVQMLAIDYPSEIVHALIR